MLSTIKTWDEFNSTDNINEAASDPYIIAINWNIKPLPEPLDCPNCYLLVRTDKTRPEATTLYYPDKSEDNEFWIPCGTPKASNLSIKKLHQCEWKVVRFS